MATKTTEVEAAREALFEEACDACEAACARDGVPYERPERRLCIVEQAAGGVVLLDLGGGQHWLYRAAARGGEFIRAAKAG